MNLVSGVLSVALSAAPWLLLGFLVAGLVRALMDPAMLGKWLGGGGLPAISRAAVVGVPLPLCSCGAVPAALSLHRNGAGRGPATAFLISTPGVGVDSIAISYALLGPVMMAARVASAIVTAVSTGWLVARGHEPEQSLAVAETSCCTKAAKACGDVAEPAPVAPLGERLADGIRYAFSDLLDDISRWLLAGLLIAGLLVTMLPPSALAEIGSGVIAMLVVALIGIPMYICATAATPIAAGMLLTGVSPGTVLVFLLAAPITSMATLGILRKEMGTGTLLRYLAGIVATSVALGWLLDKLVMALQLDVVAQARAVAELLPEWLEWLALVMLLVLAMPPLRNRLPGMTITASAPG